MRPLRLSLLSSLRPQLPHILVATALVAIMAVAYASVAFAPTSPKAAWTVNPLVINFSAGTGSGSATDSVTCSPSAGFVQLLARSSNPAKISLSASPSGFSCGSAPTSTTITATCLVPAAQCQGSYTGQVQVRQPANYRNLPDSLTVRITVS